MKNTLDGWFYFFQARRGGPTRGRPTTHPGSFRDGLFQGTDGISPNTSEAAAKQPVDWTLGLGSVLVRTRRSLGGVPSVPENYFLVIMVVLLTSDRRVMGNRVNSRGKQAPDGSARSS
jgi:hypothetical protein